MTTEYNDNDTAVPSQRRLQRAPDFTGHRLNSFREVALRHGLPGALAAILLLAYPGAGLLLDGLSPLAASPLRYLVGGLAIFIALIAYAIWIDRRFEWASVFWILWLLGISISEEWVFRVALPALGELVADPRAAVLASNALFGVIHYFTLRWKWYWCLGAALGGMALSRQYAETGDLALIIAIHWIATFFNAPRMPGMRSRDA